MITVFQSYDFLILRGNNNSDATEPTKGNDLVEDSSYRSYVHTARAL